MPFSSEPPPAADLPLPVLKDRRTGRVVPLRVTNSIGRDPGNDIRIDDGRASVHHAVLRWDGKAWKVRDLASTNGTFVDGRQIESGVEVELPEVVPLAFGDPDHRWWLAADGPPQAFAESLIDPTLRIEAVDDVIGLPSPTAPRVMIFRGFPHWTLEDDGGTRPAEDRETVVVDGHPWRLSLPMPSEETQGLAVTSGKRLKVGGTLQRPSVFVVSSEGARRVRRTSALRLLWVLAREYAEDTRHEPQDRGLTHVDLVAAELGIDPNTVDVYVCRLRGALTKLDVFELVERRKGVGQLRLGFSKIDFEPGED